MSCPTRKRRTSTRRRGTAPIELVFFLPLYFILLLTILTVGSATLTCQETSAGARYRAFLKRQVPWAGPGDVLNVPPLEVKERGVQRGEATGNVVVYYEGFRWLPPAQVCSYALSGSWDWRELPFERPQPLCLLRDAALFASSPLPPSGMATLCNLAGSGRP